MSCGLSHGLARLGSKQIWAQVADPAARNKRGEEREAHRLGAAGKWRRGGAVAQTRMAMAPRWSMTTAKKSTGPSATRGIRWWRLLRPSLPATAQNRGQSGCEHRNSSGGLNSTNPCEKKIEQNVQEVREVKARRRGGKDEVGASFCDRKHRSTVAGHAISGELFRWTRGIILQIWRGEM